MRVLFRTCAVSFIGYTKYVITVWTNFAYCDQSAHAQTGHDKRGSLLYSPIPLYPCYTQLFVCMFSIEFSIHYALLGVSFRYINFKKIVKILHMTRR